MVFVCVIVMLWDWMLDIKRINNVKRVALGIMMLKIAKRGVVIAVDVERI